MKVLLDLTEEQLQLIFEIINQEYELNKNKANAEYRIADLMLLRSKFEDWVDYLEEISDYQYKNREFEKSK